MNSYLDKAPPPAAESSPRILPPPPHLSDREHKNLIWLRAKLTEEYGEGKIPQRRYYKYLDLIDRHEKHASIKVDELRSLLILRKEMANKTKSHKHYHAEPKHIPTMPNRNETKPHQTKPSLLYSIIESIKPFVYIAGTISLCIFVITLLVPYAHYVTSPSLPQYGPHRF